MTSIIKHETMHCLYCGEIFLLRCELKSEELPVFLTGWRRYRDERIKLLEHRNQCEREFLRR